MSTTRTAERAVIPGLLDGTADSTDPLAGLVPPPLPLADRRAHVLPRLQGPEPRRPCRPPSRCEMCRVLLGLMILLIVVGVMKFAVMAVLNILNCGGYRRV